eukprot:c31229_g1_i1 orf=2-223(-)
MTTWFSLHGVSMDRGPPLLYSLDALTLTLHRSEMGRIIQHDITRLDVERTWMISLVELGMKMTFYRASSSPHDG